MKPRKGEGIVRGLCCPKSVSAAVLGLLVAATAFAQEAKDQCTLPHGEPTGTVRMGLDSLVALADRASSDALVVLQDGRIVGEWYFGHESRPIQTMSATKSVVALAVGQLIQRGHIDSLDQPVAEFFPEWRQGRKTDITVGMILSHTTGLQNVPNAGAEIYPAPDALSLALAAELESDPGAKWSYNNKAVNLLAGIFQRSTGRDMDEWVYEELFASLCIETREWYRDRSGVPHAMAGVELEPRELAKLGQLMLDQGQWGGREVVPASWIREITRPSQPMEPRSGLLWWLMPAPGDSLTAGSSPGDVFGYYAEGYLGNYLVVIPSERLVVVRMKRQAEDFQPERSMQGFPVLVRDLLTRPGM